MRERFGNALLAVLVLAAAGAIAFLSTRFGVRYDWSHAHSASLGDASVALLKGLDAPVEVTSYASRQGSLRAVIADFVDRYRRVKPDLTLRFVDPDADPDAMRAAGVSVDGELAIRYRDRSEHLKVLSEAEFSNALLRLSRARERIVAFLEGEGERQPLGKANADLGQFVAALADRGLRAVPLPLAATGKVPEPLTVSFPLTLVRPAFASAPFTSRPPLTRSTRLFFTVTDALRLVLPFSRMMPSLTNEPAPGENEPLTSSVAPAALWTVAAPLMFRFDAVTVPSLSSENPVATATPFSVTCPPASIIRRSKPLSNLKSWLGTTST